MSNSKKAIALFTFSSKLWYNKSPRALSKKDGCVSLYLQVYIGSKGFSETEEFKLRLRWPIEKIDLTSSSLLPRFRNDPDVNDYNLIILGERSKHNEIAKVFRLSNANIDMKTFSRQLNIFDEKKSVVTYINRMRKTLYRRNEIVESTYKNVGTTEKSIKEYDEFVRFDQINVKWMNGYKAWLINTRGLMPGTVWGRIKDVKHYLKLANEEKTIFVDEDAINYPNPKPVQITTYLNRDELSRLMRLPVNYHLSKLERNVLNAFLFTCFTSLRISDVYSAGNKMLVSENMLTFIAMKNKNSKPKQIKIPLIPIAKSLIDESLKTFFDLPSEQEYNRKLKEFATKAKINKRITSHVGRHTFGYLYMTTIGNLYGLKKILGHSNIETTQRYAHLDEDYQMEQAMLMQRGFEGLLLK